MTLIVTDEPPDRPAWVAETLRLVDDPKCRARDLVGGPQDWGLGQMAVHLLLIERGVALIALRLAKGEAPGRTGQPRPAASAVTRAGIGTLAQKAVDTMRQVRAEFPAEPDAQAVARHPYYGELNAFGWLLTLGNHYAAHLEALERGTRSAL